jgi:hypothetical protein
MKQRFVEEQQRLAEQSKQKLASAESFLRERESEIKGFEHDLTRKVGRRRLCLRRRRNGLRKKFGIVSKRRGLRLRS